MLICGKLVAIIEFVVFFVYACKKKICGYIVEKVEIFRFPH